MHYLLGSPQGRVGRSASVAALGDGKHSAQAATVLLPVLRVRHPAQPRAELCITTLGRILFSDGNVCRLHVLSESAHASRKTWAC